MELLLFLEVALEKNSIRVEEASWLGLLHCMGCSSADTKLWAPMALLLILHEGASTQNLTAFHFPKSRFPSSSFFFSTFTAEGIGEGDFLYPEARSDEMQLLTNEVESAAFGVTPLSDCLLFGGGDIWSGRRCTLHLPMDMEADVSGWQL